MHDSSKVLMGVPLVSSKVVTAHDGDPATYLAGLVLRQKSDGTLSLLKSDGSAIGVSLGASLSNTKRTAACRVGRGVPVLAHLKRASGIVTITSYANLVSGTDDAIAVGATSFVAQAGAAVSGTATFQAATDNATTAQSLANQINDHATAGAKVYAVAAGALVKIYSRVEGVGSTGTGNDIILSYTDNDTNVGATLSGLSGGKLSGGSDLVSGIDYMTVGTKAYINDVTGKLDVFMNGYSTVSDAIYSDGLKTGVNESAVEVACGVVDMPGGL